MRRALLLTLAFLSCLIALAISASCSSPTQPTLDVTPASGTLVIGQTAQLVVTRRFPGGSLDVVTDHVRYSSSNRNIATISDKGVVNAGNEAGAVILRV